jgi:sugar/nucleoside kinase (ribokinase family)
VGQALAQPDFLVVGHVAKDRKDEGWLLGGTAAYSALTARNLGRRAAMVTSAGPDVVLDRYLEDIECVCLPSPVTTTFVNVYDGEGRHQHLKAIAERISTASIPSQWLDTSIVHLGPIADEFDEDMIDLFPTSLLGLTPQGWLRQWDGQGRVFPRQWREAARFLPRIDALIVSDEDLAGEAGALRGQLSLARLAVVTEGAHGATLHFRGRACRYPALETQALDPTGAGDVFAAAFLVRLEETGDPEQAARFANTAASLSTNETGTASVPHRAQIEALMKNRS